MELFTGFSSQNLSSPKYRLGPEKWRRQQPWKLSQQKVVDKKFQCEDVDERASETYAKPETVFIFYSSRRSNSFVIRNCCVCSFFRAFHDLRAECQGNEFISGDVKVIKNCWFCEERKLYVEPRLNKNCARFCMQNNWSERSFEKEKRTGMALARFDAVKKKNRNPKWALIMVIILGAFDHLSLVHRLARLWMRRTYFRTRKTSYHFIVPRWWWIKGPRERKYRCHSTADNHFILTCNMANNDDDDEPKIRATANNKHCISLISARKLFSLDISS